MSKVNLEKQLDEIWARVRNEVLLNQEMSDEDELVSIYSAIISEVIVDATQVLEDSEDFEALSEVVYDLADTLADASDEDEETE